MDDHRGGPETYINMKTMKWISLFLLTFLLHSCFDFEEVKFKGIENVKMPKMDDKEILVDLTLKLENPNNFKIKIKPSQVDVFIEDKMMGTIFLDKKVVLQKRQENSYSTQLRVKLQDGAFFSLLRFIAMKEVNIRFKGRVKGSVYGITKKIDIDQTRKVNGDQLNILGKP